MVEYGTCVSGLGMYVVFVVNCCVTGFCLMESWMNEFCMLGFRKCIWKKNDEAAL